MKHVLITLMLALSAVASWAQDAKIGNIFYNLDYDALTAEVTKPDRYSPEYTGAITIPSSIVNYGTTFTVTSIGDWAFSDAGLTSITIPNSVTSIGNYAFDHCSGLTSFTLPNSVTSIGDFAFLSCSGLTSPIYSETIFAYLPNTYIGHYEIPEGIKHIAGGAFHGCSGLTSITLPNSVTSMGDYPFGDCEGITSPIYNETIFAFMPDTYKGHYEIPQGIEIIASAAFWCCDGLTSITIPNSVTSIGHDAFGWCEGLTSIYISSMESWCSINCDWIGYPFEYAQNLYLNGELVTKLEIPGSVTRIGDYIFKGYTKITSVTIGNGVTSIGKFAFRDCTGLTSVTIPNSVTSIGYFAFVGCSSLTSPVHSETVFAYLPDTYTGHYEMPNGIMHIAGGAFYCCYGLTSVTLPNSVTSIEDQTFSECENLKKLRINCTTPPECGYYSLMGVNKYKCKLYVPIGSKGQYAASQGWMDFKTIIEIDPNDIATIVSDNDAPQQIYDLSGRKHAERQKGLNIINGKKLIVR